IGFITMPSVAAIIWQLVSFWIPLTSYKGSALRKLMPKWVIIANLGFTFWIIFIASSLHKLYLSSSFFKQGTFRIKIFEFLYSSSASALYIVFPVYVNV